MGQKQSAPVEKSEAAIEKFSENENRQGIESVSNGNNNTQMSRLRAVSADPKIAALIESRANPSEQDARNHNFGQPTRPPHLTPSYHDPRPSSQSDKNDTASRLVTECRAQQRASLQCIEDNYQSKAQACADYFEAYKKCRRDEHERKLQENEKFSRELWK